MRVLVASAIYPTRQAPRTVGGAELFASKLAERLSAHDDTVLAIRSSDDFAPEYESNLGIDVHTVRVRNLSEPFKERGGLTQRILWHILDDWTGNSTALKRIIRDFRPDIVHSNTLSGLTTCLWRVAREAGVPIVHTLHDYYLTCPRCSRFAHQNRCEQTCGICKILTVRRRRATSLVDVVVGVSERILDIHRQEGLFRNAHLQTVVRNTCIIENLIAGPSYVSGPVKFGFIGRISFEKGLHFFVEALHGFAPGLLRLVVAGRITPQEQIRLRALAPNINIAFLGFVNPADFYQQVDIVVLPSLWEEPAALVIVEALAAGRPVLTSPYGGSPEVVRDGVTGWIVKPTVVDLRTAITKILVQRSELPILQANALREGLVQNFDDTVLKYREIYNRTVSDVEGARAVVETIS